MDWAPDVDSILQLRQEIAQPWREAITEKWKLGHRQARALARALNRSSSSLVNSVLTSLTDDILESMDRSEGGGPTHSGRPRHPMEKARIRDIKVSGPDLDNWLRLRNCIDISKIRVPNQVDLEEQVKNTQLASLLKQSLNMAKGHAELFLQVDDTSGTMGGDTHQEAFEGAKARAKELIVHLTEALERDMVELACKDPEALKSLQELLNGTFISVTLAFTYIEARWTIFFHPTAMGKAHGRTIMEMREELEQDRRTMSARMRAAGNLLASLHPTTRWGPLQDLRELAYMVASKVPALGSFTGADTIHRQLQKEEYHTTQIPNLEQSAPTKHKTLEQSAPRTEGTSATYYAYPPDHARVNGAIDAPLACPMDKTQPLRALARIIDGHWAMRPAQGALTTINAATLLTDTLRTLPGIRMSNRKRDWNIPQIHERFLQQSTLAGADDYLAEAAGEPEKLKASRWRYDMLETIRSLRGNKKDRNIGPFIRLLERWKPGGLAKQVECGCGKIFNMGKDPAHSFLTHLKEHHTKQPADGQTKTTRSYNPRGEPSKKRHKQDAGAAPPRVRSPTPEGRDRKHQKRTRLHPGPGDGYSRRKDHQGRLHLP